MMMPEPCNAARHHSELEDQAVVMSLGLVGLLLTYDKEQMTWPVICYPFVVRIMLINSDYLIKIVTVSY